jgi:O-antigen ligase
LLPGAERGIHPNEVAGTLLWTTPFAGCLALGLWIEALRRRGLARTLAALAFTVVAVALPLGVLILSQSRGGLFGLAAAVAVAAVGITPRRARLVTLLLVIALIVGAAYLWQGAGVQEALPEVAPVAASTGTLEFRLGVWAQAIKAIEDFTLSGMGMNVFRQAVHVLYPTPLIDPAFNLGHAHNIFLQTALDLGLFGLVGFVGLWIAALAMVARSWKAESGACRSPFLRLAAVGLTSSLIGYLVYGLLDAVALGARPGFLWWALVGLVGGLYRLEDANRDASRATSGILARNEPAQRSP